MFTQIQRRTPFLEILLGPHGVDRYTELVDPMWTSELRATVVGVRRSTPGSVTLRLLPNRPVPFRAGQHVGLTVEIDGRRHTRCYSPANAEGAAEIELTVTRRPGGLVSEYLYRAAHPEMVVGLGAAAGDFVLPEARPRRLLLIAGGSGITPSWRCCVRCVETDSTARSLYCITCRPWPMPATAPNWPPCRTCGCFTRAHAEAPAPLNCRVI